MPGHEKRTGSLVVYQYRAGISLRILWTPAAIVKSNAWTDTTLFDMAKDLCAPFGINVLDATNETQKFKEIAVQSGETCFSIIERVARTLGVLPITIPDGDLVLTYSAEENQNPVADLVLGKNIKSLDETTDLKQRFSEYIVKGQASAGGKPWAANKAVDLTATAVDKGITRYRPTVIMSEGKTDGAKIQSRANWEAQIRSGRSTVYTVEVRGWFQTPGTDIVEPEPWAVNTLVNLIADSYDIRKVQLITTVEFSLDSDGGRKNSFNLERSWNLQEKPRGNHKWIAVLFKKWCLEWWPR